MLTAGFCRQIFAGRVPFHDRNDAAVIMAVVLKKERPPRPQSALLDDGMWKVMVDCWNHEPHIRPAASELPVCIADLKSVESGISITPASDWDVSDLSQISGDLQYSESDLGTVERLRRTLRFPES